MTLLQPQDVPSRQGINDAITSEIANHASTTDPNGDHYDSDWTNVGFETGFSGTLQVRRVGKECFLRGTLRGPNSGSFPVTGGSGALVATIPAGFVPVGQSHVFMAVPQDPRIQIARVFINASGTMVVYTFNYQGTGSPSGNTTYISAMTSYLAV